MNRRQRLAIAGGWATFFLILFAIATIQDQGVSLVSFEAILIAMGLAIVGAVIGLWISGTLRRLFGTLFRRP